MNDLPPKSVKAQLVRLDDSLKQIERTQVAGIQRAPGSLPVLEAFQAFLENERKKARRRMIALTAFALVVMAAAAGSGFLLVYRQTQKTVTDVERINLRTEALAASVAATEKQKDDELKALESRYSDESRRIIEEYTALQDAQTALSGKVSDSSSALESIEERLNRLETENEALRVQLASLVVNTEPAPVSLRQEQPASPESDVGPRASALPQTENAGTVTDVAVTGELPAPVTVVESPSALLMTIVPAGQTRGVRWILPRYITRE